MITFFLFGSIENLNTEMGKSNENCSADVETSWFGTGVIYANDQIL